VASATRTIIDLAALGIADILLGAAIDSAVRLRLSAPSVVARRLAELRGTGRRGARLLDTLLVDAGGESELERRFLRLLRQAGLPRPRAQVVCRVDGRQVARVDFLFAGWRIVVEVSGQLGHAAPRDRTRDAQRRNELQDADHVVYEYTWGDVTTRPAYVAETMRERLVRAGWVPGSPKSDERAAGGSSV
jgi:very-short-patch-repair endonuclease